MTMDSKDMKVLDELRQNSKQTTSQIGKKTGIPITTVHNRIRKLEKEGIITGYTVKVDHKKLGLNITAYILLTVNYTLPGGEKVHQGDIAKKINSLPEVQEVSIVTGGTDIVLKVRTKDVDELNDFIINKLRELKGVDKTQTMVVLKDV